MTASTALVHLAAGVGNIVLATPLLVALYELGLSVHILLDADYEETVELLRPWGVVQSVRNGSEWSSAPACDVAVPAVPPFYWPRFRREYRAARMVTRPPDRAFYENEQRYYLEFARRLGYTRDDAPRCCLPIGARDDGIVTRDTVVLAPGCKTGEMTAKRWPYFSLLAERFDDVAVVGTPDDERRDGAALKWPPHVRSFTGSLTLRETAELMAGAGVVVANDSGLAHVAAAVGTATLMLFGPTPHVTLGDFPSNVRVMRRGLACEPCWFGARLSACQGRVDCLHGLDLGSVEEATRSLLGGSSTGAQAGDVASLPELRLSASRLA